jgi:NADH-quinone oxidoreductase subunit J
MSPLLQQTVFWCLAAMAVVPAIFVVTLRNIAHAAFCLLPSFLGVAGIFLILGSDFLAAVQVLIYAGAILVLLLFGLMLTRGVQDPTVRSHNRQRLVAAFAAVAVMGVVATSVTLVEWNVAAPGAVGAQTVRGLGQALLGRYLLHFEVASVLLLAAMIGAAVVSRPSEAPGSAGGREEQKE